ncbi:MAG: group II intron reverse transcriptase/maturase [Waterburya sp.]
MSNTDLNNTVEWNELNWRKIQKAIFKLQRRIFRAYVNGDMKKGRRLQKTLIKSYYNRLLSVRKVTQDNSGKRTAGVDKVKSLTPKQRLELAKNLTLTSKSKPIRRVWIPKPGKEEKRPLGIPVMHDRASQALAKAALEPEWEAKFEENSYGFRPGRSAHDAIEAIFLQIKSKSKFVLDADIAKCFDQINHQKLLAKINTFPSMRKQIKAWLKAEICDFKTQEKIPSDSGTPQGGVISPLLSNIALHGMESRIKQIKGASLIRYADDFVIFHENLEKLKQCQQIINEWLAQFDLEMKPEKTKIVNTLHKLEDQEPGFDFLGFNIRQYEVGKYQSGKCTNGKPLGFKTIIKPSKESIKRHYQKLSDTCSKLNSATQKALIGKLTPIITGWCNYYKTVVSKETFTNLSRLTYLRLAQWAKRRHPNKPISWVNNKYWITVGQDTWTFGESKDTYLMKHSKVAIKRHIKIKGNKSPFDGDTPYWANRMGKHPELKDSVAKLLKKQNGKCNHCGLTFKHGEIIESDHIIPKAIGGQRKDNLQLIHKHCHDIKTRYDLKEISNYKKEKTEEFKW